MVDLLISLIDQRHTLIGGAAGAAAVLVDPAAHGEPRWRQFPARTIAPEEQPATRPFRIEGHPQQATMSRLQLGEVGAGGSGLLGTPERVGIALAYALHMIREAFSLRNCRASSPSGAVSAC